jgi:hypothetical protein
MSVDRAGPEIRETAWVTMSANGRRNVPARDWANEAVRIERDQWPLLAVDAASDATLRRRVSRQFSRMRYSLVEYVRPNWRSESRGPPSPSGSTR